MTVIKRRSDAIGHDLFRSDRVSFSQAAVERRALARGAVSEPEPHASIPLLGAPEGEEGRHVDLAIYRPPGQFKMAWWTVFQSF